MHVHNLPTVKKAITDMKDKFSNQRKLWEGRQIRTDLKTALIALATTATVVGITVGGIFLHYKHRQ